MEQLNNSTETGINISKYIEEKLAGSIVISKPIKTSGNYVWMKVNHSIQIVGGIPTIVEGAAEIRNINRLSLADIETQLADRRAELDNASAQIAAIKLDMDSLDLL